jgi:GH15 family glucan-1,4-alpha-glucosidase
MEGIRDLEIYLINELRRGYHSGGPFKDVRPRDLFYIILYYLVSNKLGEALSLIEYLSHHQISKGGYISYIHGGHSPKLNFKYEKLDVDDGQYIGGFPTIIKEKYSIINGFYPDIDSTSLSLAAIAKTIQVSERVELYQRYRSVIIRGIKYLEKRDSNGDSLVEQLENEDWADSLLRSGAVFYSNITYLLSLQWIQEVAEFYNDRKLIVPLEDSIDEVTKKIISKFWQKDHFIEYIDSYGGRVDRASLDTSLLTFTRLIDISRRKVEDHFNYLYTKLADKYGLLSLSIPQKITRPKKYERYNYQNGAIIPLYNISYYMGIRELGLRVELDIDRLVGMSHYLWINREDGSGKGAFYKPSAAFLTFIFKMYHQ